MEKKNIVVILKKSDERDVLVFDINGGREIDLNNDEQKYLRELFYELIMIVVQEKKEISFELKIEEGYSDILFQNISKDYLQELEKEITKIYLKLNEDKP